MSDLHCAATLLLVPTGQARTLTGSLAGARIAHVWFDETQQTVQVAALLAAELGVGATARRDLQDPARRDAALAEIADEHRGETVVVVTGHADAVEEVAIDADGCTRRPWPAAQSDS